MDYVCTVEKILILVKFYVNFYHGLCPIYQFHNIILTFVPLQLSALEHVYKIYPSGRWWIKADGTDIEAGLRESMKHHWPGDVHLGNGERQNNHANYLEYLNFVSGIGLNNRKTHHCIKEELQRQCSKLNDERDFLKQGHSISGKNYKKK